MKGTLLAGAGLNPLYLSAVAMIVDGVLLVAEYKVRRKTLVNPKCWLLSNVFLLSALVVLFLAADSFLSLAIVMTLVTLALLSEIFNFYYEWPLTKERHRHLFEEEVGEEV